MIETIVNVWNELVSHIVGLFPQIANLFYTPGTNGAAGSLTFVGTLAVIMAGISILLLVFNLIRSFLNMRG